MSKIAVIGDIHGCCYTLKALYEKIKDKAEVIYSVGDLVDRGKFSQEVVQFCMDHNIKPVRGNHEDMLLKAIDEDRTAGTLQHHLINGGKATMESYTGAADCTMDEYRTALEEHGHLEFIKSFPNRYDEDNVVIIHAGLTEGTDDTIWHRREPAKTGKLQIFGHTPIEQVSYNEGWYANIDTGCVYINYGFGHLTAVVVDTKSGKITEIIRKKNCETEHYISPHR